MIKSIPGKNKILLFGGLLAIAVVAVVALVITMKGHGTDMIQDRGLRPNTAAAFIAKELAEGKKPNRLIDEKSPYLLHCSYITQSLNSKSQLLRTRFLGQV